MLFAIKLVSRKMCENTYDQFFSEVAFTEKFATDQIGFTVKLSLKIHKNVLSTFFEDVFTEQFVKSSDVICYHVKSRLRVYDI